MVPHKGYCVNISAWSFLYDTPTFRLSIQVDLAEIKLVFKEMYEQTLSSFVKDDCSGDYKRMLIAIIGYEEEDE